MNNKKNGISLRAILLYISLCTFVVIGVTFSKYITMSSGGDEARVIAFNEIAVTETVDEGQLDKDDKFILTPGTKLQKEAVVSFGGSEAATYIFLEVEAKGFATEDDISFTAGEDEGNVHFSIDDGWTYLGENDGKYIYYLALEPNESGDYNIITDGTVYVDWKIRKSELNKLDNLSLTFNAIAVQTDGRSAQEMWELVKNK